MKAIRFDKFGEPEELKLVDVPDPEPGPDDVLIQVHAVSVVPGDWKLRRGLLTKIFPVRPPKVPGRDGAGVVAAVGENVTDFAPGDRVCFTCQHVDQGSYAQMASRPADDVVRMPEGLSFTEGAAIMHAGVCAYIALVETAHIKAGDKVLIHGAAGAIGGMAVQLCKHLGAEVTGTCSERNRDHVAGLGCDHIVPYDKVDFETVVSGQDVVIDLVGGDVHTRSYAVLRSGGLLVWLIADAFDDPPADLDFEIRQAKIVDNPQILNAVVDLTNAGHLRPLISQVLPLDQAAEAHRILEARNNTRGRLVLDTQRVSA